MKPPHFDEGINGWFVDQMMKNGFYRYDPTNYHGPLHFYVLFLSQTLVRPEHLGAAPAGRAGEHRLRLADAEVRAVRRAQRQPDGRARDGGFARLCFLRPLLDPRSLAAVLLDALHPRPARAVEARHAELSLVCRDGNGRHDSDQGNLHHPCRLRGDCRFLF